VYLHIFWNRKENELEEIVRVLHLPPVLQNWQEIYFGLENRIESNRNRCKPIPGSPLAGGGWPRAARRSTRAVGSRGHTARRSLRRSTVGRKWEGRFEGRRVWEVLREGADPKSIWGEGKKTDFNGDIFGNTLTSHIAIILPQESIGFDFLILHSK